MISREQKDLLQSKTFWGVLLTAVAQILSFFGVGGFATDGVATEIATFFGVVIALYGRVAANTPIGSVAGVKTKRGAGG